MRTRWGLQFLGPVFVTAKAYPGGILLPFALRLASPSALLILAPPQNLFDFIHLFTSRTQQPTAMTTGRWGSEVRCDRYSTLPRRIVTVFLILVRIGAPFGLHRVPSGSALAAAYLRVFPPSQTLDLTPVDPLDNDFAI
jgi:hypothetical protein